LRQGQGDAALAAAVRALAIAPAEADGHLALSAVHLAAGRLEAAAEAAAEALRLAPEDWAARVQVATVAARRDDFATAARHFERAVALRPGFFEAMTNLGNALRRLGDYSAAADWYRRALALQPAAFEIRVALGNAEKDFGHHAAAIASYEAALALAPAHPVAWSNLLFCSHYGNTLTPAARHARHLDYGRCFGGKAPAAPAAARARTGPLRVGFVSADLYDHPVGFFVESMLPALAKQPDLALFAYANQERRTALTERLLPAFAVWRWVRPHDDARLAAQIRADGIDVLIDLSGHTADNRLPVFALRPAPVQATWLGYFATTGLAEMDYIIADPWVLPPEDEHWFVERPARLPNSYLCLAPPAVAVAPGPLPALAGTPFTFGSFNNLAKLGDEVVQTWCRVLDAVPGSRLLLKTHQLGDAVMRERVRERFVAAGLDPARLLLEGPAPREELLAAYHRVDIALDTFPYPGGTTSVEALWMGVPVLSLHGPDFLGRVGESILRTVGLPEWVSEDADDYVARAARFAADLPALAALRGGLRERLLASPVCDAPRFARDFAALLFALSGRAVAETR
jgi:predicted O-linked N-acetylglucosamine transferase (SPINDLY family)